MIVKKIGKSFWLIITIIPILAIIWGFLNPIEYGDLQEYWQLKMHKFGQFAPLLFILLQSLQVILTPISHYAVGALGGFLYGPYVGALYNYLGRIIGHMVAYYLSHKWGRKIAVRFVEPKVISKYDKIIAGDKEFGPQTLSLFLIYFLPLFPDDEISYIAGLSKMKFRPFFYANIFGHMCGSLSLSYIGSGINTKDFLFWFLFFINLFGFPVLWFLLRKIEKTS
ncbi:TVP38/TMEM64 family protein [bacterium]|nr:MAG: TVP38/TMEM64 family protein [bacterium]